MVSTLIERQMRLVGTFPRLGWRIGQRMVRQFRAERLISLRGVRQSRVLCLIPRG